MIIRVSTEITRPANTTAYSAGDVIGPTGGGQGLISVPMPSQRIVIRGAMLESDNTQDATPVLYLVTSSSYAPGTDNAAITIPGYNDGLVAPVALAANSFVGLANVKDGLPFSVVGGGVGALNTEIPATLTNNVIYCAIGAFTGFTPTSGQRFRLSPLKMPTCSQSKAWRVHSEILRHS